jgi:hypothetical protein
MPTKTIILRMFQKSSRNFIVESNYLLPTKASISEVNVSSTEPNPNPFPCREGAKNAQLSREKLGF